MADPAAPAIAGDARDMFGARIVSAPTVRQLPLPLAWTASGAGDHGFVAGAANRDAVALLFGDDWHGPAMLLTGPAGSGKSALAAAFAARGLGRVIDPLEEADETALFHAWNRARDAGGERLLIVTRDEGAKDRVTLPDLRTRLASAPVAVIGAPDACLVRDMIDALIARRGLTAAPALGSYVAARLERDYASVHAAVAAIDARALAKREAATIALARAALTDAGLFVPLDATDDTQGRTA